MTALKESTKKTCRARVVGAIVLRKAAVVVARTPNPFPPSPARQTPERVSSEAAFLDSPAASLVSLRQPVARRRPTPVPQQAQTRRAKSKTNREPTVHPRAEQQQENPCCTPNSAESSSQAAAAPAADSAESNDTKTATEGFRERQQEQNHPPLRATAMASVPSELLGRAPRLFASGGGGSGCSPLCRVW